MHEPDRADPPGAVEHELRAAHVHVEELAYEARGMDDRGRVQDRRRADTGEEAVDHRRVAHVADHDLDAGVDHFEQGRVGGFVHEARIRLRLGWPASARTRFWPSQPAAPVTTTVDGPAGIAEFGTVVDAIRSPPGAVAEDPRVRGAITRRA